MPTLISNHKKQQTVTRLKKAYSMIEQAYLLSEVHNGSAEGWQMGTGNSSQDIMFDFLSQFMFPYMKTIKTCHADQIAECGFKADQVRRLNGAAWHSSGVMQAAALLPDGTSLYFVTYGIDYLVTYTDINGLSKPNIVGKDVFRLQNLHYNSRHGTNITSNDRNELLNGILNPYGCNTKQNGDYCTGLIIHDGWEIKDDYPYQ